MKSFSAVGLAVAATLLTGTAAVAQNAEGLEEIIVTATKREQTLQDVPVAVSVTSIETINKASIQDVSDLASIIPSLRVVQQQTSTNTNFVIRGFGNGANNPGIEPSVGVFIDGVYRSRSAGAIGDLVDVQRVEVLRGPQSTLFGQNASAGVISVVTQKPQFGEGKGLVELTLGNYNQTIVKAKIGGSINGSDSLAYSLSFARNERDGYFTNQTNNTQLNNRNRWDVRAQLLWQATDALELRLIADSSKIDEVCCGVSNLFNGPTGAAAAASAGLAQNRTLYPGIPNAAGTPFDRAAYLNKPPINLVENNGVSVHFDWDLSDALNLTSITAYRGQETDFDYDFDFTGAPLGTINRNRGDITTVTQEIRLAFDGGGRTRGVLGAYLMNEDVNYSNEIRIGSSFRTYASLLTGSLTTFSGLETVLGLPAGTFFRSGTGNVITTLQETDAGTVFGQLDFDLSDRLTLTAGVANTSTNKNVDFRQATNEAFSSLNLVDVGFALVQGSLATSAALAPLRAAGIVTPAVIAAWADRASVADGSRVPCFQPTVPIPGVVLPSLCNPLLQGGTPGAGGLYALQFLHPVVPFNDRSKDREQTYTLRLAYEVSDSVNVYGGVSTGYKATSWNLSRDSKDPFTGVSGRSPLGGAVNPWYPRFGTRKALPEESRVVELGLKGRWENFTVNVAIFDQEIKNFQTNLFTGTGFNLANAGKQSTKGIEIETQFKLNDQWQFDVAGTFLDPLYDSFVGAEGPNGPADLSGQKPAGIHEQSISAGVNYLWSVGSIDGFIRADYLYESKTKTVENISAALASREVNTLNASVGFQAAGIDFLLWARNLNDDDYLITAFNAPAQTGTVSGYPSQPRTYGLTLRKQF